MSKRIARLIAAAAAAGLIAAGCAQGTGEGNAADASFDPDASLSGKLTVMGFGAGDEIGQVRLDEAKKASGAEVDVKLVEGDLDIQ